MPRHSAMDGTITSFCLESQKSSRNSDMDLEAGIQLIKKSPAPAGMHKTL